MRILKRNIVKLCLVAGVLLPKLSVGQDSTVHNAILSEPFAANDNFDIESIDRMTAFGRYLMVEFYSAQSKNKTKEMFQVLGLLEYLSSEYSNHPAIRDSLRHEMNQVRANASKEVQSWIRDIVTSRTHWHMNYRQKIGWEEYQAGLYLFLDYLDTLKYGDMFEAFRQSKQDGFEAVLAEALGDFETYNRFTIAVNAFEDSKHNRSLQDQYMIVFISNRYPSFLLNNPMFKAAEDSQQNLTLIRDENSRGDD